MSYTRFDNISFPATAIPNHTLTLKQNLLIVKFDNTEYRLTKLFYSHTLLLYGERTIIYQGLSWILITFYHQSKV